MFRKLTLSFILTACTFLVGKLSFANLITVNGGSTSYSLNNGDTLFIASGTYTGSVSGLNSNNKTIIVAGGATFEPANLAPTNGVVCKMHIYGTFTYTSSLTTNTNFTIDIYAGGMVNLSAMNTKGKDQVWTNHHGGTMNFFGDVLVNGGTLEDDNNVFINYDSIYCAGDFQMNSGSSFTNYKDFRGDGDFILNGGAYNNEGNFILAGELDMNSGTSVIRNYCRLEVSGGIDNSNGNFYNYSYVWAKNSDIRNTANIINSSIANNSSVPAITTPMIHARNYTHSTGGTMTGPALLYFYGTTTMTGGTMGVPGVTTDTIKMYDITRVSSSTIFDVQTGGTRHPNFIYNAWGVPDSNKVYLLGCSIEVILESPLPIKWNYFYINLSNKIPALTWSAEFDRGTVFNIQRSYDGRNYNTIEYMPSENGRSEYNYNDHAVNTNAPIVYYRIKARELNGEEKYSLVRVVRFGNNPMVSMQTVPNPFVNNFIINYPAAERETITIRMFNVNGQQMLMKNVIVNDGDNNINITEAAQLAKGIYVIQVSKGRDIISSSKIIKQ